MKMWTCSNRLKLMSVEVWSSSTEFSVGRHLVAIILHFDVVNSPSFWSRENVNRANYNSVDRILIICQVLGWSSKKYQGSNGGLNSTVRQL